MFDFRPADEPRRRARPAQIAFFEHASFGDGVARTFVAKSDYRSPKRKRGTQSDRSNVLPHSRFQSRLRDTHNFKTLVPSSNTQSPSKPQKCRNLSHCVAPQQRFPVCSRRIDIIADIGSRVPSAFLPTDPARGNPRHQAHDKPSGRRHSPGSISATTSNASTPPPARRHPALNPGRRNVPRQPQREST